MRRRYDAVVIGAGHLTSPMLRYEHWRQRPLSRRKFALRLLRHGGYGALLIGVSLLVGTTGYHHFAHQPWIDSFLNASMLLGGMGPVGEISDPRGKLFAALFALYAGLVFLIAAGLLFAPVFHRILHHLHYESDRGGG